jgi:hypothetical protein
VISKSLGETRLATDSIFTDNLFACQREMRRPELVEGTGLGIYRHNARLPARGCAYFPKLGSFINADTVVAGYTTI